MKDRSNRTFTQGLVRTKLTEEDEMTVDEQTETDVDPQDAERALERLKPTLMAIPTAELRPLRVKMTRAVRLGLSYAAAFLSHRDLFAKSFRPYAFDVAEHDNLADRAKAFWKADILMRQEQGNDAPLKELIAEAKPLRSRLVQAATYLWGDHPKLGVVVSDIRKGHGYADMADDLRSLAELFNEHWDLAVGNCTIELEEINRAEKLGIEIMYLISPERIETLAEARELRALAAEYLRRGIEALRDAACYVFRDDREQLNNFPSLFVFERAKSSKPKDKTAQDTSTHTGSTPNPPQGNAPSTIVATQPN